MNIDIKQLRKSISELANLTEEALELAEEYSGEQTEASEGIRNLLWETIRKIEKQLKA